MIRSTGLEVSAKSTILKTTTAVVGSGWVVVGNANANPVAITCNQISVFNTTGFELQFGYGVLGDAAPAGETFELPTGVGYLFRGLNSTGQLFVRRTDQSNSQVIFKAVAESV